MRRYFFILIAKTSILLLSLFASPAIYSQCSTNTDAQWYINETLYGSKKISDCNYSYNCFGFVRAYFENGCTAPSYIGPYISPGYTCPSGTFQNLEHDGYYVEVCSESHAKIAYYTVNNSGNHVGVKEVSPAGTKYLSKYGNDGPLVGHNLNNSYYHYTNGVNSTIFYTYVGKVQGPNYSNGTFNINGTSNQAFSVLSSPGLTYTWSIESGNQNIYISSGQNTNSIMLSPTHSGAAQLKIICSSGCGNSQIQIVNINITTNICLEGIYSTNNNLNTSNNLSIGGVSSTVTCPNANLFTWQRTSGSVTNYYTNGNLVSFTMTSGGTISFLITAKNGAQTLATRNVSFYNYGSFIISPNPANELISIDLNSDLIFNIDILNFSGILSKTIKSYRAKDKIDISNFSKGEYIMWIYHEEKLIKSVRFLVEK